jgi:signal transduction histidine kinase
LIYICYKKIYGTGLGLVICKDIIAAHGGRYKWSKPYKGT